MYCVPESSDLSPHPPLLPPVTSPSNNSDINNLLISQIHVHVHCMWYGEESIWGNSLGLPPPPPPHSNSLGVFPQIPPPTDTLVYSVLN